MGVVALLAAALTIIMVAQRANDQPEVGRTQTGQEQTTGEEEKRQEQTAKDNEKDTDSALPEQPEGAENHGNEKGSGDTENNGNQNDSEGATEFLPEQGVEQPGNPKQPEDSRQPGDPKQPENPEPGQDKPQESNDPSPIELPFLPYEG